jgi:hypothetical protein
MAEDDATQETSDSDGFGSCCEDLEEVMSGAEFEPLITVGSDDVLYMSVGQIELEDDEPGLVDHPMFYCPFCGKELQTVEEVRAKTGETNGADNGGA